MLELPFSHLWVMRAAAFFFRAAQRVGLQHLATLAGLGDIAALAPRLPARTFRARGQRYDAPEAQGTAFLHAGCVMSIAFPSVHEATVRMLQRARLNVTVPAGQGCCGAIAVHAGEPELGREMARKNIEAFEQSGADVYVVNAAGCGSALKEYSDLFSTDDPWRERALRFSSRVRDILEVLDAVELPAPQVASDAVITYQEPCHLAHAQRITAAPRRLLALIPGARIVEMRESALCCGSAGIYNLTQREMASRLGRRKVQAVLETGADLVATANPGCAMQIAAGLRAAQSTAHVRHVVELLDAAYSRDRVVQ